jgi:adenylate kinase family enzyme
MGGSCVGKTTLSRRLAEALGVPHVELDALYHGPGWQEPSAGVFQARVLAALETAPTGWVVDGTYLSQLGSLVLDRADTVVVLEPPLRVAFARALRRTIRRTLTREVLWNGNRERLRDLVGRDWIPWWVLRTHRRRGRLIAECLAAHPRLRLVRLTSAAAADRWLQSIQATDSMSGSSKGSERQKMPPFVET